MSEGCAAAVAAKSTTDNASRVGSVHGSEPSALGDSDDDFQYEEVKVESDEDDDISEDLDAALRSLQSLTTKAEGSQRNSAGPKQSDATAAPGKVLRRPEVVDDFLRNFFAKAGLSRTAEAFEAEWYELKSTGRLQAGATQMPDVYLRNSELEETIGSMRAQLAAAHSIAERASATWDRLRKERDFHRMHHQRVAQEKNKLITDIRRLKTHYGKYEPTILELKRKYESAMKEKMLASLERDKMAAKAHDLEEKVTTLGGSGSGSGSPGRSVQSPGRESPRLAKLAAWPVGGRPNPYDGVELEPSSCSGWSMQKSFKGHQMSVAALALHPTKPILVTASDDKTWKMWHLPGGDLVMCGEGHKDWVAGVDFHPSGTSLASGSGDATVKIWSFEAQRCIATFAEHKQAVWGVRWHDQGDWLASCSLDHTVRLWDAVSGRCRQVLRGHVDSVNDVAWQPFSNVVLTASSDKTVSTWDVRSGLATQTFYGHKNSCNSAVYNCQGSVIASTDADGMVKLWDTRMVAEILTIQAGKYPANKATWDPSGQVLAVPSDDGRIKCYNSRTGELLCELAGHEEAVQAALFDPAGAFLVSGGSDNTFKLWS